jgi:hypothetical protein
MSLKRSSHSRTPVRDVLEPTATRNCPLLLPADHHRCPAGRLRSHPDRHPPGPRRRVAAGLAATAARPVLSPAVRSRWMARCSDGGRGPGGSCWSARAASSCWTAFTLPFHRTSSWRTCGLTVDPGTALRPGAWIGCCSERHTVCSLTSRNCVTPPVHAGPSGRSAGARPADGASPERATPIGTAAAASVPPRRAPSPSRRVCSASPGSERAGAGGPLCPVPTGRACRRFDGC